MESPPTHPGWRTPPPHQMENPPGWRTTPHPPGWRPPLDGEPPPLVNVRAVRILLECILFYDLFPQGRGAWPPRPPLDPLLPLFVYEYHLLIPSGSRSHPSCTCGSSPLEKYMQLFSVTSIALSNETYRLTRLRQIKKSENFSEADF